MSSPGTIQGGRQAHDRGFAASRHHSDRDGQVEVVRDQRKRWFQDWEGARTLAARTKYEAVNGLDAHLTQFTQKLEARGTKVHWASTGPQACEIILGILKARMRRWW